MKRCKMQMLGACLWILAAVPAYCQRGTLGIDVGQTSDKFGSQATNSSMVLGIDGQFTVLKPSEKSGGPNIVAGGEMRFPTDSANHAREYALFGGPIFQTHNFTIGASAQIRKIVLPPEIVGSQVINRDTFELVELPVKIGYDFGSGKHAFVRMEGAPEFTPRFKNVPNAVSLPHPNLDHGYFVRGTAGYNFGKLYAKASYESRYFKFAPNAGNPNGLYNWRTNLIMGGIGIQF